MYSYGIISISLITRWQGAALAWSITKGIYNGLMCVRYVLVLLGGE